MNKRPEFSKKTKRQALERSQMRCEAVGSLYGLNKSQRCSTPLCNGVEFDHELAASNGGDNSLENCVSVCPHCHRYKTTKFDIPRAAKTVRLSDKAKGIVRPKSALSSHKQPKAPSSKITPPRRSLYEPVQERQI